MSKQITMPFLPEWGFAMLSGKKTATSRPKKYGEPGDWFRAFGEKFVLFDVYPIDLQSVATNHYYEEGCDSEQAFKDVWNRIHYRKRYTVNQIVYFHRFKLVRGNEDDKA